MMTDTHTHTHTLASIPTYSVKMTEYKKRFWIVIQFHCVGKMYIKLSLNETFADVTFTVLKQI